MKQKLLILFLFPILLYSQDKAKSFNEINIGYTTPKQLENSFLKQAYENKVGLFLEFELITYKNIGLISGFQYNDYKVTNKSIAGNISSANQRMGYFKIVYHYDLINKLNINPYIGIGLTQLKEVGKTNGKTYMIGTNFNYNFYNDISLLLGVQYATSKYDINTNASEKNLFNSSSNIQFNLGFNFRFSTLNDLKN